MIAILFLYFLSVLGILSAHVREWVTVTALLLSTSGVVTSLWIIYKRSPDND